MSEFVKFAPRHRHSVFINKRLKLCALLCVVCLLCVTTVYALYECVYQMSGTIYYSEEVPVYLDANCSILMPSVYNWGILTNGISKNIWVKNIGDVAVNVSIEVLNPLNCYINVSPSNLALIVGKVEMIDLSIEVYGEPSDVVSWGLKVSAEKA